MAADAGGATKACIEEGGACAASGGPACCTARRTGAPLKCVVAAGRRLCAGPPAVPAVPFARRRVEARMTGRGAQVQLWLSPPAAGTGLTTTFSVRLKEKIGNHYFKNGALYIVKVTKVRALPCNAQSAAPSLCLAAGMLPARRLEARRRWVGASDQNRVAIPCPLIPARLAALGPSISR